MTHSECQDLLLDLAYGELDAVRAAEVQSHLSGCPDCQREEAQMARTRRMVAPLREVEEPPARFDARILAAARAEAHLQSDGLPGEVIEVKGSVQPMGLQAARIDTHAAVAPKSKRKASWATRVAVGGSIAAAAGLALVMGASLQSRKQPPQPAAQFEIRVGEAARKAQSDAVAKRAESEAIEKAELKKAAEAPAPVPQEPQQTAGAERKPALKAKAVREETQVGGGSDVADQLASRPDHAKEPAAATTSAERAAPPAPAASPPPAAPVPLAGNAGPPLAAVANEPSAQRAIRTASAPPPAKAAAGRLEVEKTRSMPAQLAAPAADASMLESQAQSARHAGNYALAASLYRSAAQMRQSGTQSDAGTVAWDLAHEVECLAAAGLFDQARQVRADLQRLHPSENMAISAANRALQAADLPAAKAAEQPASPPQR
ncbi:MAG: hypothetical protein E6J78_13975 [Deltaproteobacteria bacterium]|nr:MAG: hypothetical protein E6J78_13975 [Deltaproteobacteria bacterium]